MRTVLLSATCLLLLALIGCGSEDGKPSSTLRIGVTTSTRDSGLLEQILPEFEKAANCKVEVIAQGTGAVLRLGASGDVDAVIVHARAAEESFMSEKHGVEHEEFMLNYFTLLGPETDPAKIKGTTAVDAFKRIAKSKSVFISRGDDSGTHKREQSLLEQANIQAEWEGYLESGQGMGATLIIANEKLGYVLTDMGTYLKFADKVDLKPLIVEDDGLRNPYSVIMINPDKSDKVNETLARQFIQFLIRPETQQLIGKYQLAGQHLFQPTRLAESK